MRSPEMAILTTSGRGVSRADGKVDKELANLADATDKSNEKTSQLIEQGGDSTPGTPSKEHSFKIPEDAGQPPLICGLDMKWVSLVSLTLQTTWQVFVIKFSRAECDGGQCTTHLNSTVILFSELLKLVLSFCLLALEYRSVIKAVEDIRGAGIGQTLRLSVPALAYVVQNNLTFFSLDKLSAAVQQVSYQLKIVVAAVLSVFFLGRTLTRVKWIAIFQLLIGVVMVQYPRSHKVAAAGVVAKAEAEWSASGVLNEYSDAVIGFSAVVSACFVSGFAGVYMEKILKQSGQSIWLRNIQLSIFGSMTAFAGAFINDGEKILEAGLTQGYSWRVIMCIFTVATGGLLCAAVLKYADNILRQFATALSIILTSLVSWTILQDFQPDALFVIGTALAILATFLYNIGLPSWLLSAQSSS